MRCVCSLLSQENLNIVCDTAMYSLSTQHAMAQLNEKEIPFELIEVCSTHAVCLCIPQ